LHVEETDRRSPQQQGTIGHAGLGLRGDTVMTPAFAAHDGDTVFARALTNISIRFVGVDTAEVAFTLPGIFRGWRPCGAR
jgi:hypothetical protein